MSFQKMKLLTGATLSVLLSAVAIYPASAAPESSSAARGEGMSRMDNSMKVAQGTDGTNNTTESSGVRGRITRIVGNVVTMMLPDGTTQSVTVTREDRDRFGLKEGMQIFVKRMGTSTNADVTVERVADTTTTTDTTTRTDITGWHRLRGTVTNIDGNQVTILTRPGDRSETIAVYQRDLDRLNLRPGMEIVAVRRTDELARVELASYENSFYAPTATKYRLRGTVTNIDGNRVTLLTRPDDRMRSIRVERGDIDRLNLRPGMEIVAVMNVDGRRSVYLANNANSDIRSSTTLERRSITSTTTAPAYPATDTTDTTIDRSTETTDTSGSVQGGTLTTTSQTSVVPRRNRPVRALW
jgi:ribosome maturation factor RimP